MPSGNSCYRVSPIPITDVIIAVADLMAVIADFLVGVADILFALADSLTTLAPPFVSCHSEHSEESAFRQ
jgi:hypothetical protein